VSCFDIIKRKIKIIFGVTTTYSVLIYLVLALTSHKYLSFSHSACDLWLHGFLLNMMWTELATLIVVLLLCYFMHRIALWVPAYSQAMFLVVLLLIKIGIVTVFAQGSTCQLGNNFVMGSVIADVVIDALGYSAIAISV
jgi:hypothetical protein